VARRKKYPVTKDPATWHRATWYPVPYLPPADDDRNGDKALGESQAKFDARVRAHCRKKAGPRQRRVTQ
jgi:hypothetical protein